MVNIAPDAKVRTGLSIDGTSTGTGTGTGTGTRPAPDEATAALVARQRRLLDAFSEAFVGLRKGYEQFGSEVGVRTINGATPLHQGAEQPRGPQLPDGHAYRPRAGRR